MPLMKIPVHMDGADSEKRAAELQAALTAVKCPYCGRDNAANACYCAECGTSLVPNPETEPSCDEAPAAIVMPDLDYSSESDNAEPGSLANTTKLPTGFLEELPTETDAELYDILAHQEDYLPAALAAAKAELRKRNLTPERVAQLETSIRSRLATEDAKARERLSSSMRILIFIFAGLPGILLAGYYTTNGYKRKAVDSWITLGCATIFQLVLGVLIYSAHRR